MDFEWIVPKIFKDIPAKKYINPCCIGGDEVLIQLKPGIASQMNVDENSVVIYQEDWGWALELVKDKVVYLLAVSNEGESANNQTLFIVNTEATRKEKGLFLSKTVNAPDELQIFSEIVSKLAEKNGFEKN